MKNKNFLFLFLILMYGTSYAGTCSKLAWDLKDLSKSDKIFRAVLCEQKGKLEKLAAKGADLEFNNPNHLAIPGFTPLITASFFGYYDEAKILVKYGANVNARTPDITPLIAAKRSPQMTKLLIDAGADVNLRTDRGETALHNAAKFGLVDVINLLIHASANPNFLGSEKSLFSPYGDQVDTKYPEEARTPLMFAIAVGHIDTAKALIDGGADVKLRTPNGFTALHYAMSWPSDKGIQLLIDAGADVNAMSVFGETPLSLAQNERAREILRNAGATK